MLAVPGRALRHEPRRGRGRHRSFELRSAKTVKIPLGFDPTLRTRVSVAENFPRRRYEMSACGLPADND